MREVSWSLLPVQSAFLMGEGNLSSGIGGVKIFSLTVQFGYGCRIPIPHPFPCHIIWTWVLGKNRRILVTQSMELGNVGIRKFS